MRRLLFAAIAATFLTGVGFAGAASASPHASSTQFTCAHFSDPTVEYVWAHACHDI